MKRIGLALGGGGAKGLAHIAFLKVFDELKIKPSVIAGTSMGALVGALYASGLSADEIKKIYLDMKLNKMYKMIDIPLHRRCGFVKGNKIMAWFSQHLRCHNFEELQIPLKVIATDYWKQEQVVMQKGNIAEAVRASISIPVIFEPAVINDRVLVDGGVLNPVPYDVISHDCDILIAIDVQRKKGISHVHPDVPKIYDCIFSTILIMSNAIEDNKKSVVKPDIHMKVSLPDIRPLDFHKMDDVLRTVKPDVARFRKELRKVME